MNVDVKQLFERTVSIHDYLEKLSEPFKEKFFERKRTYKLNSEVTERLKEYAKKIFIVAFSAEWCKDCTANIPVLALLSEKADIKIRVFGNLKKDPLNPKEKWRIPPSPPEVKTFNVDKIPHIMIFNRQGKLLGTIIENPKEPNSLEEEILEIVEKAAGLKQL